MKRGMGGHQSAAMLNDEWLTPPSIVKGLGVFDLDPCSPINRPWDTAKNHYTLEDDGLVEPWHGRVWLNPPYGRMTGAWLEKLAAHGNGIALIFARTETEMFFKHVWNKADAVFFVRGRLHFHYVNGERAPANAGAPSCLVVYGQENIAAISNSGLDGQLLILRGQREYRGVAAGHGSAARGNGGAR